MPRPRRKPEPKKGLPGYMATYADMVTLLLTFFVLLMGMANFDDSTKVRSVIQSIRQAFGVSGIDENMVGLGKDPAYPSIAVQIETVAPPKSKIRPAWEEKNDAQVQVTRQNGEVRLQLDGQVFFRAGSSSLHPAAFRHIGDIARMVRDLEVEVSVEGHTDPTGDETENWELSALRAASVVSALRLRGIEGGRLAAVGRGQFQPGVGDGADVAWNRRIEFVIRGDQSNVSEVVERMSSSGLTNVEL